jgi:thiol-disulfide isomerase/thioredoxin
MVAIVAVALTLFTQSQTALEQPETPVSTKLGIGSKAPSWDAVTWLKGTPPKPNDGKLVVIDFWATWCGPCIASFPELTKIQQKYKDDLTVVGISVYETGRRPYSEVVPRVKNVLETFANEMQYVVGMDDAKNTIEKTWLLPAEIFVIPTVMVLDKNRKIAWIGHPYELEAQLQNLIK